ncbi:MAG: hypothetical protein WD512_17395 [Candidatus Paceibacterota bacterium]
MNITEFPVVYIQAPTLSPPPTPPYEVAVNLHLWGTNPQSTKNTFFMVGDRVRINLMFLSGGQFPSEIYHDRISFKDLQKFYDRALLVGQHFIVSRVIDHGNYDVIDVISNECDPVYGIAFCPNHLDKV